MGVFINVDGTNGSGKSRMVDYLEKHFRDKGYKIKVTREPGGTEIGRDIRSILLNNDYYYMDKIAETLLFFADRAQHYKEVLSNVDDYDLIITDRFVSSTYVYQHYMKNISKHLLETLYDESVRGLKPDLSVYMISKFPHNKAGMGEIKGDRFDEESFKKRDKIIKAFNDLNISKRKLYVETDDQNWSHYRRTITAEIEGLL